MAFSYEELRSAAVEVLLGRGQFPFGKPNQWAGLRDAVAVALAGPPPGSVSYGLGYAAGRLSQEESELLREAFWELFRQGYITLGINDNNAGWPFYTLSRFGQKMLVDGHPYRFTNTASYLEMVRRYAPDLDDITIAYLDEAVQAFYAGCILASNVMLGVATENRFNILAESVAAAPAHSQSFEPVLKEKLALRRIVAFHKRLALIGSTLPPEVREDLDTQFTAIQSVIRASRNEAGHPTGKPPDREATYVYLHLFAPFGRKLYQLQTHLCS